MHSFIFQLLSLQVIAQTYTTFSGNGSTQQGWPNVSQWLSYEDLWMKNLYVLNSSCSPLYGKDNSLEEIQDIKTSLPAAAEYAGVPSALFFVMMMQESDGCVRVGTTANAVSNPGLMQSNNGGGNCIQTDPCPAAKIQQMLMDGAGLNRDFGLKQAVSLYEENPEPAKYFRAARAYNAGPNGVNVEKLELGGATRCYASDIANRLLGWTHRADTVCPFDRLPTSNVATSSSVLTTANEVVQSTYAAGTTSTLYSNCSQTHLVVTGDTCNRIAEEYRTTFEKLRELNPRLNSDCTNLWLGYTYCVG